MRDPFESSPALRLGDAKAKPREALVEPRPTSLAPEFGDAFGAAFSKPRTYSFADEIATISPETWAAALGNVAHETRRPVGDGAMRYEPRGFVEIKWPRDVSEETIDELIESYVGKGFFPSLTPVEARTALRRGYEAAKAAYRARISK